MVIPLTRIWFLLGDVIYKDGKKKREEDVFAEYDLIKKKLVWKQWRDDQLDKNMKVVSRVLMIAPLSSPLVMVFIVGLMGGYTKQVATPKERLGDYWVIVPIILALLIFVSFDFYMLNIRRNAIIMPEPDEQQIRRYLRGVSYKDISKSKPNPIPYAALAGMISFLLVCTSLTLWVYVQPDTILTFIAKLIVLSIILSVIPLILFYVLGRALIIKKYLKNEMEK